MRTVKVMLVLSVVLVAGRLFAEPEVFSSADYETDRTAAIENDKLHLVYFTASWCPPCQQMKKTTWVDESLVGWLNEHAVVSSVDVDEQPKIASDHEIRAMPTMVVFEDGAELGRVVGYQNAVELKGFMERAASGELAAGNAAVAIQNAWRSEVDAELEKALEHYEAGETEKAVGIYSDLFAQAWEKERSVVDPNTMPRMQMWFIGILAGQDEGLRESLAKERDRRLELLREGEVTWERLCDWAFLNNAIGDEAGTIAWAERNTQVAADLAYFSPMRHMVEEALVNASRLDLLAEMIDPLRNANDKYRSQNLSMNAEFMQSMDEEIRDRMRERFIEEMSMYYTIALMQDDEQSAGLIAEKLLGIYDGDDAREALEAAAKRAENE